MWTIIGYLSHYWRDLNKRHFLLATAFIGSFIFCNYFFGLNSFILSLEKWQQYISWYLVFFIAFITGYAIVLKPPYDLWNNRHFLLLLALAPLIFSWKITASIDFIDSGNDLEDRYWNLVIYYPFKAVAVLAAIFALWKLLDKKRPFYGFRTQNFDLKPYIIMLMFMVPLIAAASTQADFLTVYPKMLSVNYLKTANGWEKLLYELSYGSDFFTIEIFFRGFLVLAFVRFAGKHAIIPMALFYCTIHFGKPVGECISSFFGGMILGVVTYKTRSIWGGLIVHLGIAWLMELGGYIARMW